MNEPELNQLAQRVIGAAIEVHRVLGPGLLEPVYEDALCHELALAGIGHERQVSIPVRYKGIVLKNAFRVDVLVERQIVLELKSVDEVLPIHKAQVLTYLRMMDLWLGYVLNFNEETLVKGVRRLVSGDPPCE
ncbi:MAG TPA: GxxExxY protein [Candidatus Hydrogenedentes bacterium]|nr:GxxExxY protein [Candidatus Hydrogenedentota bacterium]